MEENTNKIYIQYIIQTKTAHYSAVTV